MRGILERRLSYLYSGEFSSVIIFVFVSYIVNAAFPELQLYSLYSFWAAFFLLEWLLIQGTIYWYAKLKRLRKENISTTPTKIVRLLQRFKVMNVFIIFTVVIAFIFDVIQWYPSLPVGGLVTVLLIYVFAILEYINYFYIQLSYNSIYDIKRILKNRKWKTSSLKKDMKRLL
ncbi:hypothetical protein [Ureibacillus sinduriensis]|uniref:General stress protein n=1 Tax=Ureibacillus sinduriensis BLB-1 = JCM 15800 TaxID=1384057 RepID=A0A0A3HY46_9BACL|nr:hypothetical protein [Ureibacillus sinduriensis]KGR76165.1 general stress protein [Ureibacillus sinduriensis BLB-1 = JCM 15800]